MNLIILGIPRKTPPGLGELLLSGDPWVLQGSVRHCTTIKREMPTLEVDQRTDDPADQLLPGAQPPESI